MIAPPAAAPTVFKPPLYRPIAGGNVVAHVEDGLQQIQQTGPAAETAAVGASTTQTPPPQSGFLNRFTAQLGSWFNSAPANTNAVPVIPVQAPQMGPVPLSHEEVLNSLNSELTINLNSSSMPSDDHIIKVLSHFGVKFVDDAGKNYLLEIFKAAWNVDWEAVGKIYCDVDDTLIDSWRMQALTADPLGFFKTNAGIVQAIDHFVFTGKISKALSVLQNFFSPDQEFNRLFLAYRQAMIKEAELRCSPKDEDKGLYEKAVTESIKAREAFYAYAKNHPFRIKPHAGGMAIMTQLRPSVIYLARWLKTGQRITAVTDGSRHKMFRDLYDFPLLRAIILGFLPRQIPTEWQVLTDRENFITTADSARLVGKVFQFIVAGKSQPTVSWQDRLPQFLWKIFAKDSKPRETDYQSTFSQLPPRMKDLIAQLLFDPSSSKLKIFLTFPELKDRESTPLRKAVHIDNAPRHTDFGALQGIAGIQIPDRANPLWAYVGHDLGRKWAIMAQSAATFSGQNLDADSHLARGAEALAGWLGQFGDFNQLPAEKYGEQNLLLALKQAKNGESIDLAEFKEGVQGLVILRSGVDGGRVVDYDLLARHYEANIKEVQAWIERFRALYRERGELSEIAEHYQGLQERMANNKVAFTPGSTAG